MNRTDLMRRAWSLRRTMNRRIERRKVLRNELRKCGVLEICRKKHLKDLIATEDKVIKNIRKRINLLEKNIDNTL